MRLLAPGAHSPTFVALPGGVWHGPELALSDTTESTTDAGTARTTLRYGTEDNFNRACRSLTTG